MAITVRNDISIARKMSALKNYDTGADLAKEIANIPTAQEASKVYALPLTCQRTGLVLGQLTLAATAGHLPVIGQWKESMVLHPLFSLEFGALLHFARNTWFKFCNFTEEEAQDAKIMGKQEQTLQVCALAMLYQLSEVRQDVAYLPTWQEVSSHWSSLVALSYFKLYLDSQRFRFPAVHISKWEKLELSGYLDACWATKKDYETRVSESIEREKLVAADKALIAIRNDLAGKAPRSPRMLWRWFESNMPRRYSKDIEGWMWNVYTAKGDDLLEFTLADFDVFEEIFLCEIPTGNVLSHAFLDILRTKRKYLEDHFQGFQIVVPAQILEDKASGAIAPERPLRQNFASKALFMIAEAKWKLAHTDLNKQVAISMAKQSQVTVRPSYVPVLDIYGTESNEDDSDDTIRNMGVELSKSHSDDQEGNDND